jgi:hypothetical protein
MDALCVGAGPGPDAVSVRRPVDGTSQARYRGLVVQNT